jgi:hypothetical protein
MSKRVSFLMTIFLAAGMLSAAGTAYGQGPQCSSVLMNDFSQEQINQTVALLAGMKEKVDLAQSRGGLTILEKKMASSFKEKFDQLIQTLAGQLSETQLRTLIGREIQRQQNSSASREKTERFQKERDSYIHNPGFLFSKRIPIADLPLRVKVEHLSSGLRYVEQNDSLYYTTEAGLIRLDLKSEREELVLPDVTTYRVSKNGIIVVTNNGKIFLSDFANNQLQQIPLAALTNSYFANLSFDGKYIALIKDNRVEIYNIQTGRKVGSDFNDLAFNWKCRLGIKDYVPIKKVIFLSNFEILIIPEEHHKPYKFNFVTGEATILSDQLRILQDIQVSPETGDIVISLNLFGHIASINVKDLEQFDQKAIIKKLRIQPQGIDFVGPHHVYVNGTLGRELLYAQSLDYNYDLTADYDQFPRSIGSKAGFDPVKKRLFLGVGTDRYSPAIEIWTRDENGGRWMQTHPRAYRLSK